MRERERRLSSTLFKMFQGCRFGFLSTKTNFVCLATDPKKHQGGIRAERTQEPKTLDRFIYIFIFICMYAYFFSIILIINMYLVGFFFCFSLENHHHHHRHHHFHSSAKGTRQRIRRKRRRTGRMGEKWKRSGGGWTEGGPGCVCERAQYKPHPRRLLAMMISVTASNTTWMFPVSVAQVK